MKEEIISTKDICLNYNNQVILEDINFKLYKADYLGMIGPNGAGKTTLIKILLGLIKPTSGEIYLFKKKLGDFKDWRKIGYVPQRATSFDLNFPSTVEEIVGMGLLSGKAFPKILSKEDKESIRRYLERVGMFGLRKRRIGQLSGGQQQRVFIARTLVAKPELLILDEPTTGVDKNSQEEFYNLIGKLNKEDKLTIIIISHDISYITKYVTKVACVNQKLLFHGTHREFCSSGVIDRVLGHEKHIVCHDDHVI